MTELLILFSAMIPFLELKLAIPLGLELGLSSTTTFLFATTGAIIPAAIFLAVIGPLSNYARLRFPSVDKFFTKLFQKTRKQHSKRFNKYGALFILLFIPTPLPGSGTVAAALIAFLFGVNYWKALALIAAGAVISSIILLAGFNSIFKILDLFA